MPPRFSYWTIILDGVPTAFRARHREDLLPTFKQLQHTNPDAVMKWFARGRIWESPEEAAGTLRQAREATGRKREGERRGPDWRPGGKHVDPRARYKKSARKDREGGEGKGTWRDRRRQAGGAEQRKGGWRDRPAAEQGRGPARRGRPARPWRDRQLKAREQQRARPPAERPHGARRDRKPAPGRERPERMRHQTPPARKEHRQPDTGTPERPEIQPPPPPVPPGPDRPPRPGEEPPPEPRTPETIRILPEPRKRAKD